METKELISLDLGMKRTGIARASTLARIPEPLKTVPTDKTLDVVRRISSDKEVEAIVVGLPRNLKGDDTAQTQWVRAWVAQAQTELKVPFFWQDEALTSHIAEKRNKFNDIDAEAAAIILQDFLDTPEQDRVVC